MKPLHKNEQEREFCALCLQKAKLCKSHIIPKFIVKRHRSKEIHNKITFLGTKLPEQQIHLQDGAKEHLLCVVCEKILEDLETYSCELMESKRPFNAEVDGSNLILSNFDGDKLKLFYLSLFWRMSVTKHVFFKKFKMDKDHEESARKLLHLKKGSGHPDELGIIAYLPMWEIEELHLTRSAEVCDSPWGAVYGLLLDSRYYLLIPRVPNDWPCEMKRIVLRPFHPWFVAVKQPHEIPVLDGILERWYRDHAVSHSKL